MWLPNPPTPELSEVYEQNLSTFVVRLTCHIGFPPAYVATVTPTHSYRVSSLSKKIQTNSKFFKKKKTNQAGNWSFDLLKKNILFNYMGLEWETGVHFIGKWRLRQSWKTLRLYRENTQRKRHTRCLFVVFAFQATCSILVVKIW